MTKSLFHRLFGFGKIQAALAAQLKEEGIVWLEEGIKGSVTLIDFRSPGKYSNWKRQWFTVSIALTQIRVIALRSTQTIINVPLVDERIKKMKFSLEKNDTLLVAFDASLFHEDWSGTIEYRFRMEQPQMLLDKLNIS